MFAFLRGRGPRIFTKDTIFDPKIAGFIKSFSSKKSSPGVCENDPEKSLTVSYLINSCGLSSSEAILTSKELCIKSPERSDAVLELLRKCGFTNAHITQLVTRWPSVLRACPKNSLLPKLEFFRTIGVPPDVLARNLSLYPLVLQRSLKCYLIPCYNFLKGLVKSDELVAYVFQRVPRAFANGWEREINANIAILRERGVRESSIALLLARHPSLMMLGKEKLSRYADQAAEMGFDAKRVAFIDALRVFAEMSESTLQRKMDAYRSWGLSESEIKVAFLKHPLWMKHSEKKIMAIMDFLVNKMGLEAADVARKPLLLSFSLEKRIKPRCRIVEILKSKGLLKRNVSMEALLTGGEEKFLKRYIVGYQDHVPQLLDIYQGKLSLDEVGFHQD